MIYIQEDSGNSSHIAKAWQVDPNNPAAAVQIFESNRDFFISGATNFLPLDEEHSGIIDVTDLFADASWYSAGMKVFLATPRPTAAYPVNSSKAASSS